MRADQLFDAVVCQGAAQVKVAQLQAPALGRSDVLVRRTFSGVSTGTDRWVLSGRFEWGQPRYPFVPGYQAAGVVVEFGSDVDHLEVGQNVVITTSRDFVQAGAGWGGHAAMGVSDVAEVYDAADIPAARASLAVVAQVGYNAASRLLLEKADRVAVIGDGIIGFSAALACLARGFEVLLVGRHDQRLASAAGFSIATLNARSPSMSIMDFAPLAVIDTVQNKEAFDSYAPALPHGTGQIVFSGHSPDGVTAWADMAHLQQQELTVHFVSGWYRDRMEATLDLMRRGAMDCDRLIGDVADTPDRAISLLERVIAGRSAPVAATIDWSFSR